MKKRIFSENFKREKVRLYETGKMSILQLSRLYDLSDTTLYNWVKKYRSTPKSERIVLESDSDYVALMTLQDRVDKMERLIGNQQMTIDYLQSVIKSATDHYGEDVEKKFG